MEFLKLGLALLLIFSIAHAHGEGELRFVNGYIIEFHSENDDFEFHLLNEAGDVIEATPLVQIFKGDKLVKEELAHPGDEDYYAVNKVPGAGKFEIRPVFAVDNKIIAARFSYEVKGNIIDQIISFILSLFSKEKTTDVHEHADFALYVNGEKVNFSQPQYMENSSRPMSELVHLHDLNGIIIHKHATGVNLGHFFGTIAVNVSGMQLYVNGVKNDMNENYEFSDLDRLLITIGNYSETEINSMISSVTDQACIQSGKCPERGSPGNESSCTSAGGCKE